MIHPITLADLEPNAEDVKNERIYSECSLERARKNLTKRLVQTEIDGLMGEPYGSETPWDAIQNIQVILTKLCEEVYQ